MATSFLPVAGGLELVARGAAHSSASARRALWCADPVHCRARAVSFATPRHPPLRVPGVPHGKFRSVTLDCFAERGII
jgi:hypothetical protein